MNLPWRLVFVVFWLLACNGVTAAEPVIVPGDLPRVPPSEPPKALSEFKLRNGFRVELAAAEPDVFSPVAMAFDEEGRMFVVEMRDYSERRDERLGRIRRLVDQDGDGRFETSTVFLEGLPWPTAVICYGGGVFVGATPDILFCQDTDGDGKADMRQVVFTGFAEAYAPYRTNQLNVQALMNSFAWGLDNRIHGATSLNGGKITSVTHPELAPVDLRGRDFSFDPRTLTLRAENGGGQHGMSFDNRGRKFVCSNSAHIRQVIYEARYAAGGYNLPGPTVDIAVDGPAAEVFRLSPDEPWRVVRTRWRIAGLVPGPVEGGGRSSGYFTGATGVTIYRGDAWPPEFVGDAFIADCGSNLIHRKELLPNGVELKAQRAEDEQQTEFLASPDNWFRPVQMANGPDGALYVADMYREVIEHPWSLPAPIKQHLDLNSGSDRGRIYRIAYGQPQRGFQSLGKLSSRELANVLGHANGWHRDTAARLLFERRDYSITNDLLRAVAESNAWHRLHALYALDSLERLAPATVKARLKDPDPVVREHALILAERFASRPTENTNWLPALAPLANDPSVNVRFRLALAAGEFRDPELVAALDKLAQREASDPWFRAAIIRAAGTDAEVISARLMEAESKTNKVAPGMRALLTELATIVGRRANESLASVWLDSLAKLHDQELRFSAARNWLASAQAQSLKSEAPLPFSQVSPSPSVRAALSQLSQGATAVARDETQPEGVRGAAIRLLGEAGLAAELEPLKSIVGSAQPEPVQFAVIDSLERDSTTANTDFLLARISRTSATVRSQIINALLRRKDRTAALVRAITDGAVAPETLAIEQMDRLRGHSDPAIRAAAKNLGRQVEGDRQAVVGSYLDALALKGERRNGQRIFEERCRNCHRLGGEGHALGPDLESVKASGKEQVLVKILDPNREVLPQFIAYTVETRAGETLTGVIAADTPTHLTLRAAGGLETVLTRAQIKGMQSQARSLMPEGLETGLSLQDLADLLEFMGIAGSPGR